MRLLELERMYLEKVWRQRLRFNPGKWYAAQAYMYSTKFCQQMSSVVYPTDDIVIIISLG